MRECYDYAEKNDITVVGDYIDRALTGKYDYRPNFQKMIADAPKKQFDYIIVRFARNRYDSAIYKHKLKQCGVKVLSACENISDSPESIILEAVLEASAEYYSVDLSQKVRRDMKESALKANSTGGHIPLGYKLENKKLVIDDKTAHIVKYVFEEYSKGISKTKIVEALNEKGIRTKMGKPFNFNSLRGILTSKKYIGIYHYNDIEIAGGCPALIDTDIFEKCQKVLDATRKAPEMHKAKIEFCCRENYSAECAVLECLERADTDAVGQSIIITVASAVNEIMLAIRKTNFEA